MHSRSLLHHRVVAVDSRVSVITTGSLTIIERKYTVIRGRTRVELLTTSFQVVHIQISGDEFESTMDAGGRRESRYQTVWCSFRPSETVGAGTLERVLIVINHRVCV
jgi:hypothetical protein